MTWTHDLAMLTSRLLAALREVELAREELERATHYEQATSRWWCDQVHRARAEERGAVVAYLRSHSLTEAADQIERGDHKEQP